VAWEVNLLLGYGVVGLVVALVFAVASSGYLVMGMVFEERSLVEAAPQAYREYQRDVRWKVIPGVY